MTAVSKTISLLTGTGLFTPLDLHFARFIGETDGTGNEGLVLAAALVSNRTQNKHVCLDLRSQAQVQVGTLLCPTLAQWTENLRASKLVGKPGEKCPLILDESRVYLERYWAYEERLVRDIMSRVKTPAMAVPALRKRIESLFPAGAQNGVDYQRVAAAVSLLKPLCVIAGGPGTGKTTTVARILALLVESCPQRRLKIALTAPTGKAAMRLREAVAGVAEALDCDPLVREQIPTEASTIHRLLGYRTGSPFFRHNREHPLDVDVVVVDESSMVDLPLMAKLMDALPAQARVILLGDRDQLSSVEAGAVLGHICEAGESGFSTTTVSTVEQLSGETVKSGLEGAGGGTGDCIVHLTRSYRFTQDSGIGRVAGMVRQGRALDALSVLRGGEFEDISWRPLPRPNMFAREVGNAAKGYREYLSAQTVVEMFEGYGRFRILCAPRKGVYGVERLNALVELTFAGAGLIDTGNVWYERRPVLVTENDYALALYNGDTGITARDPGTDDAVRVLFREGGERMRSVPGHRLNAHQTAYAMTVHKSQGSEFDRVLLILPEKPSELITRELIYTALTRARNHVEIWAPEQVLVEGIERRMVREAGLADKLRHGH